MHKVLILTNDQDIHADLVLRVMEKRGADVIRFHPSMFPKSLVCRYVDNNMQWGGNYGRAFELNDISSVWYRRPEKCKPCEYITDPTERKFVTEESQHVIENMYMLLENAFWVNPYFANIRARYKLLQRKIANRVGIEMPDTIVTNDPEIARAFIDRHNGNVVYKCVRTGVVNKPDGSSDLIFTNRVSPKDISEIEQVRFAPCVFMCYINKVLELRVTVVGERVFTCAIYSQKKSAHPLIGAEETWSVRLMYCRRALKKKFLLLCRNFTCNTEHLILY